MLPNYIRAWPIVLKRPNIPNPNTVIYIGTATQSDSSRGFFFFFILNQIARKSCSEFFFFINFNFQKRARIARK
ncbi:hypothetical protein RYX36_000586, partial [Vicia faba]